jgi:transcriptional regulator with XRE-family HTH domain
LGLSFEELARKSSVSARTIRRIEREDGLNTATEANLKLTIQTLGAAGIELIGTPEDGPGVRLWRLAPKES